MRDTPDTIAHDCTLLLHNLLSGLFGDACTPIEPLRLLTPDGYHFTVQVEGVVLDVVVTPSQAS